MILENFSWLIENEIAGMAHPGTARESFAEIKACGLGAVVTLTERPLPERLLTECDLAYIHLPVPNFQPPQPSQVRRFMRFVRGNTEAGRAVLVHCLAGYGRTGTMLACHLVNRGMPGEEAIRAVRARRPGSIETPEQEETVLELAARIEIERQNP